MNKAGAATSGPRVLAGWSHLLIAGVLLLFSNGRDQTAWAPWLAPLFMVLFLRAQPLGRGLALGFAIQLLAFFFNWRGMIPVPGVWYFVVAGTYAAIYFLPFAIHRWGEERLTGFAGTLFLPASWVAIEFLFQRFVTPYGSWASLAYTQVDHLSLLQLAAVAGVGGIHFMMLWTAAVAAWVWRHRSLPPRARAPATIHVAVLLGILLWGHYRLASVPASRESMRIASLTPSARLTAELEAALSPLLRSSAVDPASLAAVQPLSERLSSDLLARTLEQARAGAEVVVWSEHAARVTDRSEPHLIEAAGEVARASGATLVLGVGTWRPEARPRFENKAIIIDSSGTHRGTYFKAYPIVGRESSLIAKGRGEPAVFETPRGRIGLVICHDLDFPDFLRAAGRHGVLAMVAPSADWAEITPQHARMAILRAVENGCSLVRPCQNGLTLAVDPLGRILAAQADRGLDGNAVIAHVPVLRASTVYPRAGDAFSLASAAGLLALLVAALRTRRGGPGRRGAMTEPRSVGS